MHRSRVKLNTLQCDCFQMVHHCEEELFLLPVLAFNHVNIYNQRKIHLFCCMFCMLTCSCEWNEFRKSNNKNKKSVVYVAGVYIIQHGFLISRLTNSTFQSTCCTLSLMHECSYTWTWIWNIVIVVCYTNCAQYFIWKWFFIYFSF